MPYNKYEYVGTQFVNKTFFVLMTVIYVDLRKVYYAKL